MMSMPFLVGELYYAIDKYDEKYGIWSMVKTWWHDNINQGITVPQT